jgi:hypothetical protein
VELYQRTVVYVCVPLHEWFAHGQHTFCGCWRCGRIRKCSVHRLGVPLLARHLPDKQTAPGSSDFKKRSAYEGISVNPDSLQRSTLADTKPHWVLDCIATPALASFADPWLALGFNFSFRIVLSVIFFFRFSREITQDKDIPPEVGPRMLLALGPWFLLLALLSWATIAALAFWLSPWVAIGLFFFRTIVSVVVRLFKSDWTGSKARLYAFVRDENNGHRRFNSSPQSEEEISRCVEGIRVDCAQRESYYLEALQEGLPRLMHLIDGRSEKFWEGKFEKDSYTRKIGRRLGFID